MRFWAFFLKFQKVAYIQHGEKGYWDGAWNHFHVVSPSYYTVESNFRAKFGKHIRKNFFSSYFWVKMSGFQRLGHALRTAFIFHKQVDPPFGYSKESLNFTDFKTPNIYLLWRSPKSISKGKNKWQKYLPVGSFVEATFKVTFLGTRIN